MNEMKYLRIPVGVNYTEILEYRDIMCGLYSSEYSDFLKSNDDNEYVGVVERDGSLNVCDVLCYLDNDIEPIMMWVCDETSTINNEHSPYKYELYKIPASNKQHIVNVGDNDVYKCTFYGCCVHVFAFTNGEKRMYMDVNIRENNEILPHKSRYYFCDKTEICSKLSKFGQVLNIDFADNIIKITIPKLNITLCDEFKLDTPTNKMYLTEKPIKR